MAPIRSTSHQTRDTGLTTAPHTGAHRRQTATRPGAGWVTRLLDLRATVAAEFFDPMVRQGLLGMILVVLGSLSPAFIPQASPLWGLPGFSMLDAPVARIFAAVLVLSGFWLVIDAWMRLRPAAAGRHDYRAVLAIWGAPMLLAPPMFSHDAYSYAAQGWLVGNGIDPYQVGPGALPGPFADMVSRVWLYTPAPYGPLGLQYQHALVDLTAWGPLTPEAGSEWHTVVAAVAMRLPALVGVVLLAACLPGLLRRLGISGLDADRGAWFALANPLMLIHFIGGAHNDSLMVGFVVWALWLAAGNRIILAALAVGVGTAVKQPAALAGVAVAVMALAPQHRTWRHWREVATSLLRVGALAGGTFAAVSMATGLHFGWLKAMTVPGSVPTIAPSSLVSQTIVAGVQQWGYYEWGGVITGAVQTMFVLASLVFMAWIFYRIVLHRPISMVSWGLLAYAIGGAALHGWYLLWGGLLLPATRPTARMVRAAIWVSAGMTVYHGVDLAMRNDVALVGFAAIPFFAVLMWRRDRDQALAGAQPSQPAAPVSAAS